jgi:hypothetical protein
MATFAPPPETMAIYAALQGSQTDTNAFFGLITEAVSPTDFFEPENISRILKRNVARLRESPRRQRTNSHETRIHWCWQHG